jgi:transcriptional regulator
MYVPQQFEESRAAVLHALIGTHPLGALVTAAGGELAANHIPFLIDAGDGRLGTLRAHVSRANPVWKQLGGAVEALVIFQGPQTYITPSWYPSKHADGKAVPTWNYAVVHAYGRPRAIEDPQWLLEHVTRLTRTHESGQALPWEVTDAPREYIDRMIAGIVGIELPISRLQGKWKVSQNRPVADRLGVAAGLESRATDAARAMAALVRERAAGASS